MESNDKLKKGEKMCVCLCACMIYCKLFSVSDVHAKVDITERTTTDLSDQLVFVANTKFHFPSSFFLLYSCLFFLLCCFLCCFFLLFVVCLFVCFLMLKKLFFTIDGNFFSELINPFPTIFLICERLTHFFLSFFLF